MAPKATHILLVEDGEQNITDAKKVLGDISVAKSYAQFEELLSKEKPDAVLSDLYFPTGYNNETHEKIKTQSAAILDDYIKQCQRINPNPIGSALELIFKAKGISTIDEYFNMFKDDLIIQKFKDHIRHSHQEHEKVRSYQQLAKDIKD